MRHADRWQPDSRSDGRLFDGCCEALDAARHLEELVSGRRDQQLDPAVLGCLGAAFDSLANTVLMLRETVEAEPQEPQASNADRIVELDRLLFAINQNLRFSAEAADLGRQTLAASVARSSA